MSKGSGSEKVHAGQILCRVAIKGRLLPDERKGSIIMDHQKRFNRLAKDAHEHEDRKTVLTRQVVHLKCVRLEWKKPVTFRTDAGTHAYAVGRQTDENVYERLVDQMLRRLESLSSTMGIRKFRDRTTHRTSERCAWILSRKIGGSETQHSRVLPKIHHGVPFHSLTAFNFPRCLYSQLTTPRSVFGDVCT